VRGGRREANPPRGKRGDPVQKDKNKRRSSELN